ncbi:MAG TPA: acetyl-CoA carboxylase biotin carboxylase subunit [Acidobacteriota bacterium]|nr:acetyl-CoA carboxylase biotin carboxylase subunit [Acidobacteriota bacterium]
MIRKILVANRGEIAVRVLRACREMGIASVAVYSEADRDAFFTRYADECHEIGPAAASQSYLNILRIIETAKDCGCDAIHPGYGFLAENPEFAAACENAGINFIGPPARVLALSGDKVAARREMQKAGIPVVPGAGECVADVGHARCMAAEIGYPVIIKPSGGGGGIGMTIVDDEEKLAKALEQAREVAGKTFGMGDVYIEKYLSNPRHIEFQILADSRGSVIHLGERECSIQRRHQKLIEESPSPALTAEMREKMGLTAVRAAAQVNYKGAGTVEFLFAEGKFYFLEVNARIQVEHPVTEMVTGLDLVKEQIRIASGLPLGLRQEDVRLHGCAIECRINAEDPFNDFLPVPGIIKSHHPPGGPGIRVDSGVCGISAVSPHYDPMIAKLIAWGRDRCEAIARMRRALDEYVITGIKSTIPFHRAIMENERFAAGNLGTQFLERETTLPDDMKRIVSREQLWNRLSRDAVEKKKIAAVAAAAMVSCGHQSSEGL